MYVNIEYYKESFKAGKTKIMHVCWEIKATLINVPGKSV